MGFDPGALRTMRSRFSLMRRGTVGGGSQSRTSRTVSGRFRTRVDVSDEERISDRHVEAFARDVALRGDGGRGGPGTR